MKKHRTHGPGPLRGGLWLLEPDVHRAPHPLGLPEGAPGDPVCLDASLRGRGFRTRTASWARRGVWDERSGWVRRAPDRRAGLRGHWGVVPPVGHPRRPSPRAPFVRAPFVRARLRRIGMPSRIPPRSAGKEPRCRRDATPAAGRARGIPRRLAGSRAALRAQTQNCETKPNLSALAIGEPRDFDVDDLRWRNAAAAAGGLPALELVQRPVKFPVRGRPVAR
jgi:hypothetical protein